MIAAYVFVEIDEGDPFDVRDAIRAILPGVQRADIVTGQTDCIVIIQDGDTQALVQTLFQIRAVAGVARTDTHFVLERP